MIGILKIRRIKLYVGKLKMIIISLRLPKQPGTRNRALVLREITNEPNANYSTCYEDLDSSV